jgi:secondary thiamine-phosphate synthase enzyme
MMIEIETRKSVEVIDITDRVLRTLQESSVKKGILLVYSLHTTTGLTINEADGALINDLLSLLQRIAPQGAGYLHDRGGGNAHAHLQATLLGNSLIIPVEMGRLVMGVWQRILFFELDGPRRRSIFVRVLSDLCEKNV